MTSSSSFESVGTRGNTVGHGNEAHGPSYQAFQVLHWGFVAAPVIAGLDKFFHLLTNWDRYLASAIANISPIGAHDFMLAVGVIEMAAGLIVAIKPRIGAYVVAAWLVGIIVNLLLAGGYYDIALRDFGLCLGAIALGRLSAVFDQHPVRALWHREPARAH